MTPPQPVGSSAEAPLASIAPLSAYRKRGDDVGRPEPYASDEQASPERWVTKKHLAAHLGVTPRWIEQQQRLGLPHLHMGGINRYRISEVEVWLRDRYAPDTAEAA